MKLVLTEKKTEAPDVTSFIFEPTEPLTWVPGQYAHYVLHHEPTDERGSDRWFTLSSAPYEKHAAITTRLSAEGSSFKKKLQSLEIGKKIEISVVEGDFVIEDDAASHIFIAGGIGITPFHSILKHANHDGMKLAATLLYANRDEHFPFRDEFDAFSARNPELSIKYLPGVRIDEAIIRESVADLATPIFYVSGPEPMVESIGSLLKEMGVSDAHLKQDWFPGYPAE